MHRAAGVRAASAARSVKRQQKRQYLNLYPKPDANTMPDFVQGQMYYQLPDYVAHKDHKQLRPVQLDETNTSELTREEERIQRIKVMNWREGMRQHSRRSGQPQGTRRASWSGAQALEWALRNADASSAPALLNPASESAMSDPEGLLPTLQDKGRDAAVAVAKRCFTGTLAAPHYFRQVLEGPQLNELTQRFSAITGGAQLPLAGMDIPEVLNLLSRGIRDAAGRGSALRTYRKAAQWFKDFTAAVADGTRNDAVYRELARHAATEYLVDWSSSNWNTRLAEGEDLSEESFSRLVSAYHATDEDQASTFWKEAANIPEFRTEYAAYMSDTTTLSQEEARARGSTARSHWTKFASILEKAASGILPEPAVRSPSDWSALAQSLVLAPLERWVADGDDLMTAFSSTLGDEVALEIQAVFDEKIGGDVTFGDWVQWEVAEKILLPLWVAQGGRKKAGGEGKEEEEEELKGFDDGSAADAAASQQEAESPSLIPHPSLVLGSLFANLGVSRGLDTVFHDTVVASEASATPTLPVLHFLRRLSNPTSAPGYNVRCTAAFFKSASAAEAFAKGSTASLKFSVPAPVDSPEAVTIDVASMAAELVNPLPGRDFSTADAAAESRADVEAAVRGEAYVGYLEAHLSAIESRHSALELASHVAEDFEILVGHLRRKFAGSSSSPPPPEHSVADVAVDGPVWRCGEVKRVRWQWTPNETYPTQLPTPQQKEAAFRKLLEDQRVSVQKDNIQSMVSEVLEKANSISTGPEPGGDRRAVHEWPLMKMFHKWKRESEEAEVRERLGIEQKHRVRVALYRKNTGRLEEIRRKRQILREFVQAAEQEGAHSDDRQLAEMLQKLQVFVVDSFVERNAHHSGLSPVHHEILRSIRSGEFQEMLEAGDHLTGAEADSSNSLWEYVCDLSETRDATFDNTGELRVRLPFTRGGARIGTDVSQEYRVSVIGIDHESGGWKTQGHSLPFTTLDPVPSLLEQYVTKKPDGLPKHSMLPAEEVPELLHFVKSHPDTPIELDLVRETMIGADVLVMNKQGTPVPMVHINMLAEDLRRDHHREEADKDPIISFAARDDALKEEVWRRMNPGATTEEWVKAREEVLNPASDVAWWSHDPELEEEWSRENEAISNPKQSFLDAKISGLFTTGTTPLATAQYEGLGYVSHLEFTESAKRVRVPLFSDPSQATQARIVLRDANTGEETVVYARDGGLACKGVDEDEEEKVVSIVRWHQTTQKLYLGDKVICMGSSLEAENLLSQVRRLAKEAGVSTDIPDEQPLQLHHLADICKEAINAAHSRHCFLAEAFKRRYAPDGCKPNPDEQHLLPTILNAWELAGAPQADAPPTGLAIRRRRFDSWQLNSGRGRYDHSPTKDEQWQHPIEENPVLYGFQDTQEPMSTM